MNGRPQGELRRQQLELGRLADIEWPGADRVAVNDGDAATALVSR